MDDPKHPLKHRTMLKFGYRLPRQTRIYKQIPKRGSLRLSEDMEQARFYDPPLDETGDPSLVQTQTAMKVDPYGHPESHHC